MKAIFAICVAAIPFLLYFLCNKSLLNYFSKVYKKTLVNPITVFQQIVGFLFYSPIVIGMINDDLFVNPFVFAGIPVLFTIILLFSNVKFKNPIRIVALTIAQIVFGFMFICRLFVWIFAMTWSILMSVLYGRGPTVEYNPFAKTVISNSGEVSQVKNRFFFTPDSYSDGVLTNLNKYTADMDASRIAYERGQLENELEEIEQKKQHAMIYGYDISNYEDRESKIKSELRELK